MMGAMDHSEVRELLEDAAIEPGGLERLMAGDTPMASIVAGHLAGCPDCADELERLRRSVGLIRPTVRTVPPPELKARTMAYVAELGVPRGAALRAEDQTTSASAPARAPAPTPAASATTTGPAVGPNAWSAPPDARIPTSSSGRNRLAMLAGLAAALIVAVVGTSLVVNAGQASTTKALTEEVEALGEVTRWTLRVDAQPDVRRIQLASEVGSATGSLVFSPSSTELVVVAEGLAPPPAGKEYRCWVDVNGARSPVGKMFFGGALAYWVGKVPEVGGVPPNARFGVTLVDLVAPNAPGQNVLVGGA
jgi:hypothetical protein